MRNLHLTFDYNTYSQKLGEDFAKFCGLLRIYELYLEKICTCFQAVLAQTILNGIYLVNVLGSTRLVKIYSQYVLHLAGPALFSNF